MKTTTTLQGKITDITDKGVTTNLHAENYEETRFFGSEGFGNSKSLFDGLIVGDKFTLDIIEDGDNARLEYHVKKIEEMKKEDVLIIDEPKMKTVTRGIGVSYYMENLLKDSFVIDINKESSESFESRLTEGKNQDRGILIIGSSLSDTKILEHLMKSNIKATLVFEDIDKQVNSRKIEERGIEITSLNTSGGIKKRPLSLSKELSDIEPLKPPPSYQKGEVNDRPYRSGGNNRKIKKRKKAKNGRRK